MNVLITGGTGFIGSRLTIRCLQEGHQVRVLAQENTEPEQKNRELIERLGAEMVTAAVTDREQVALAVKGVNLVFHLAAAQHEMNVPDEHFWTVNVEGTRTVVEAALTAGVSRLVHGSTIGVYGDPEVRVDEASKTSPVNIYGRTKLEGERLALSFADRMPVVAIRIPEVYGPGDARLLKLFRAVKRGRFFFVGRGKNLHHPMFIDDLIDGLWTAAQSAKAPGELFVLAGKDVVTTNDMVAAVAEAVGRPTPRLRLPTLPFLIAAYLLEVSLRPVGVQPPLHRRRLDFFRKSFHLSADKAARVLGFRPATTFKSGARKTAAWYEGEGLL